MAAADHPLSIAPGPHHRAPDPEAAFVRWLLSRRRVLLILSALFALLWTLLYLQYTVDDAFISFRYGHNLVLHHTWNWNPSGPHEEAYTSLLYTALGILPALLHLPTALFFKLVGLACIAAIILRLRAFTPSPFAILLATLLLALHPFVWIHAYAGLETPLYILLIVELALAVHRASVTSPAWLYTLCLLLPLTRPDGLVFSFAALLLFWRARGALPKHLGQFAIASALGVTYFLARWRYFHHLLPNPFYAKVGYIQPDYAQPGHAAFHSLLRTLFNNLMDAELYFFTLLLILLLSRRTLTRVFALVSLLLLLFLYAPNNMYMNYADRFYFQLTLPALLLFFLVEDVARMPRIAAIMAAVFLLAISPSGLFAGLDYYPILKRAHIDVGRRLAPFAPGHTLLVGEAGAVPFYSGWVSYDFLGLGTHSFSDGQVTLAKIQALHPDLILVFSDFPGLDSLEQTPGPNHANPAFAQYLRQTNAYDYIDATPCNGYFLLSFLRKDTPQHDAIRDTLLQGASPSDTFHLHVKDILLQRYVPWTD